MTRTVLIGHAVKTLARMNTSDYSAFVDSYDVFDDPQYTTEDENKVNASLQGSCPTHGARCTNKVLYPAPYGSRLALRFPTLVGTQELFEAQDELMLWSLAPGKGGS